MTSETSKAPGWQYLLWIGLAVAPVVFAFVGIFFLPTNPAEAPKGGIVVSRGVLGLSTNPYLKRQEGGTYRLLCPVASYPDRHRRSCFDDRIWKMKGEVVTVSHGQPVRGGITKVVICDITDAGGKSLVRSVSKANCG